MDVLDLSWVGLGLAAASIANVCYSLFKMSSLRQGEKALQELSKRITRHEIVVSIDGKTTTTVFEGTERDVKRLREDLIDEMSALPTPSDSIAPSGNKNGSVA